MSGVAATKQIPFQADWPRRYDPSLRTLSQRVAKIAWDVFSIIVFPIGLIRILSWHLRNIALRIAVPGRIEIKDPIKGYFDLAMLALRFFWNPENFKGNVSREGAKKIDLYEGESLTVKSPDGATIDGGFFPTKHSDQVILFVGGNGEQWEDHPWLELLKPLGTSLLFLNVRGVGESKGTRSEDGYAMDIYTAAEWLIHEKGIDPEKIVFGGFSMGGANSTRGAALIQEKYPSKKIRAFNINSFSALATEIDQVMKNKGILLTLGRWGSKLLGIDIPVSRNWKILRGEKLIFRAKNDPMIPYPAQLATAIQDKESTVEFLEKHTHFPFGIIFPGIYDPNHNGESAKDRAAFYHRMRELLDLSEPNSWSWFGRGIAR